MQNRGGEMNPKDIEKENESFEQKNHELEASVDLNQDVLEPVKEYKYAGFWMRFWAYLLDIVVISSINRIIVYPIFRLFDFPLGENSIF